MVVLRARKDLLDQFFWEMDHSLHDQMSFRYILGRAWRYKLKRTVVYIRQVVEGLPDDDYPHWQLILRWRSGEGVYLDTLDFDPRVCRTPERAYRDYVEWAAHLLNHEES